MLTFLILWCFHSLSTLCLLPPPTQADRKNLQCLPLWSSKGAFFPHGVSGSWGQSRAGSQSTSLEGDRAHSGAQVGEIQKEGSQAGRGPRVGLPWISSPVDEIWLRHKLADPISSRQSCLKLGNTRQTKSPAQLCLVLPKAWVCL